MMNHEYTSQYVWRQMDEHPGGISEQFGPRQAVVVHCQQVEQVAERKKQSHYQAGKQAKQEQGPEIVPALLGLYTDVLHP